eukprot:1386270-Amphidinium_carterae.1
MPQKTAKNYEYMGGMQSFGFLSLDCMGQSTKQEEVLVKLVDLWSIFAHPVQDTTCSVGNNHIANCQLIPDI